MAKKKTGSDVTRHCCEGAQTNVQSSEQPNQKMKGCDRTLKPERDTFPRGIPPVFEDGMLPVVPAAGEPAGGSISDEADKERELSNERGKGCTKTSAPPSETERCEDGEAIFSRKVLVTSFHEGYCHRQKRRGAVGIAYKLLGFCSRCIPAFTLDTMVSSASA